MIQINLLPHEYRGRERLSIRVWGTLLAAVVVVCCSVGYFGHVYLNEYKRIEAERIGREAKLRELEPLARYDDALQAEAKDYKTRAQTIQGIANSRVLWTRLLDLFVDIVNNEGDTERHHVWFQNLAIGAGSANKGPTWGLQAFSQTKSWSKQANFLDDVKNNPEFFKDFASIVDPGGRVVKTKDKHPPEAIAFKLDMRMHPPSKWARNQKKAQK